LTSIDLNFIHLFIILCNY